MADRSPEERVIESIWGETQSSKRLAFQAGEVTLSVTEPVVWLPFLVVLLVGWISVVALLPIGMSEPFVDLTLGWLKLLSGDFSVSVLSSLVASLVGMVVVFVGYTRAYGVVVGFLLERS